MVYQGYLIASGNFTQAGGIPAHNIARWDGSAWQVMGSGMNTSIYCLTGYNGQLIAGGEFTRAGGEVSVYLARWGTPQSFVI